MSEFIKDTLRFALIQFFIITVCIMFVIATVNTMSFGVHYPIDGTFPWVMMLTGLITSLPSFLLCFRNEPTKRQYYVRILLHFICIEAIVMTEGRLLGWYTTVQYGLIIAAMVMGVYALVWFFSTLALKSTAKSINKALEQFNSDEE